MLKSTDEVIREAQQQIDCVDVETALRIYRENPGAVIIDVRETDSAGTCSLSESVNISRGLLEMKVHKVCAEPDNVILLHCGGGGRASLAAHTLRQIGYRNVYAITAPYEEIKKAFG